jgi:hypothetical protein
MASSFYLDKLFRRLSVGGSTNELQKALTHSSFYTDSEHQNAHIGSRYVFLGQYAFKGEVATYLFSWVSGTGTQIQHFLGNLFKNPILERLFDEYELFHVLRAGENFDTQKHKHIFVYALLGFVLKHADKKQLYHFIGSEIITPNKHLFPSAIQHDILSQLRYKTKQVLEQKIAIKVEKENDLFTTKIETPKQVLAEATSKSKVYSRKKAIKTALKKILELELEQNPYLRIRLENQQKQAAEQKEQERKQKLETYQAKKQLSKKERQERLEKNKLLAQHRDKLRRASKKRAKETTETQQTLSKKEIKKLLESDGHLMNAAKRRKLEDKLK